MKLIVVNEYLVVYQVIPGHQNPEPDREKRFSRYSCRAFHQSIAHAMRFSTGNCVSRKISDYVHFTVAGAPVNLFLYAPPSEEVDSKKK